MNKSTFRNLAIVLFALIAILVGVEMSDRRATTSASGGLLFPDLKSRINDVDSLVIAAPGEEAITISNASGTWSVANRDDYPAQVGKIRELLLALADAQILEEKTANPERYGALGVDEPELPDSRGVRLAITGDDFGFALIVGDINQGSNRYVRVVDQPQSLLIDADPDLPDSISGWLRSELVDIESSRVSQVNIRHADDEVVEIYKSAEDETGFQVQDLPEGRELSYPTIVNGMASVLNDLELEDVRRALPGEPQSVSRFETFDGLRLRVGVFGAEDDTEDSRWISIQADANEMAEEDETADEDGAEDASNENDAAATAAAINDRLGGWQFRVAGYKLDQLTRRWEDLLKAEED